MWKQRRGIFSTIFNHPGIFFADEGGEGGGGGEGAPATFTQDQVAEQVSAAVAKAKDEAISGVTAKNKELLGKMNELKSKVAAFGDLDPAAVKNMFSTFEQNEELKLISEGKYEDVIHKRIEKSQAEFTSKLDALTKERDGLLESSKTSSSQIRDLLIDSSVVTEFVKQGGSETAIDDIKLRAKSVFDIEEGNAVPRGPDGELLVGANGTMTQEEWVTKMKQTAPHLFKGSKGASSHGVPGAGGDNDTVAAMLKSGDREGFREMRRKQIAARKGGF